jgi:hypothetical protein
MMSKTFFIALLFVTSLNFKYLPAQDSGCTTRTVPVSVVDHEWNFLLGLGAGNFRAKLHGRDVEVLSASVDTNPRHIVLLLDASGSTMEANEGWKTAKSLSEDLIRFAPPRASIAQMVFSDTVLDTAGFDQDQLALLKRQAVLVKACERPRKARMTRLYDAISSAQGALGALDFGDVIYAVTYARDNKSQIQPETVEEDLLRGGVRLFSAVIQNVLGRRAPAPMELEGPDRLYFMVEATGGNVLTPLYGATTRSNLNIKAKTRGEAVELAVHRLYDQMGMFYRLDLKLPETVDKPTEWKLEVIDENGAPERRVEIHYPHRLMPCTKAGCSTK